MSDYSDFIVLLARQRSGTNALRSVLDTHPEIHCFDEVFLYGNRFSKYQRSSEANYFNFLAEYANGDVERVMPDKQEEIFHAFMGRLRYLSPKPRKVIDVKLNTSHIVTRTAQELDDPFLFTLMCRTQMNVLNITRRHYLRFYVSLKKALDSGTYHVWGETPSPPDESVPIDVDHLLGRLYSCIAEDSIVNRRFSRHSRFWRRDYTDIFTEDGGISRAFLRDFSHWLGVEMNFVDTHRSVKLATLPLSEAIRNWDEVEAVLRETPLLAHCVEDEQFAGER